MHLFISIYIYIVTENICEGYASFLSCFQPGHVLQIYNATFGRTDSTTCRSATKNNNIQCSVDASKHIKFECEGYSFCTVSCNAGFFGNPCLNKKETRKYLTINYKCSRPG